MSTNLRPVLAKLAQGETLSEAESEDAFGIIMSGEATPAQIAGLLMAMRVRRETVAELTGAVRAMRARMTRIEAPAGAIDVVGTDGDNAGSLNISTAVTFVLAGLGLVVAKHGNRALSSRTGAADVLTALGVNVDVPMDRMAGVLRTAGCAFMFAPRHHAALRHAAGPRVELGTRTIFNLLGPLANPAGVTRQLTGVFDPGWARPMAETLANLGSTDVWLVHGQGLDELTVAGTNQVVALKGGAIREFTIEPEEAGLTRAPVAAVKGGDAAFNAAALEALLGGAPGPYRDTVVLNAAAALVMAGRAGDLREGAEAAARGIDQGAGIAAPLRRAAQGHRMSAAPMSDALARICADTAAEAARRKAATPLAAIERAARAGLPPRGFLAAALDARAAGGFALIAEIGVAASPSGGLIRPEFDPALARAYRDGGAACLSVLTDGPWFQGEIAHLQAARAAVPLPAIRKDFMLEPWQIFESRAIGADCVLLIMAALDDAMAAELEATALGLGMDVLAEVHDAAELARALRLRTRLIGINNRNLKTLQTDIATTIALAPQVPTDRVVVGESGLRAHADLARLAAVGVRRFLVGESLMRQADVAAATRALLEAA